MVHSLFVGARMAIRIEDAGWTVRGTGGGWSIIVGGGCMADSEFSPVSPGEILKEEFLAAYKLTQADLARATAQSLEGTRSTVLGNWGIGELADPIRHPRSRAEDQYGQKFAIFCPYWSRGQALPGSHPGGSHMADFRYFPSWSGLAPDHLTPIGHLSKNPAFSMLRKIAGDGRVTPDHDERGGAKGRMR